MVSKTGEVLSIVSAGQYAGAHDEAMRAVGRRLRIFGNRVFDGNTDRK